MWQRDKPMNQRRGDVHQHRVRRSSRPWSPHRAQAHLSPHVRGSILSEPALPAHGATDSVRRGRRPSSLDGAPYMASCRQSRPSAEWLFRQLRVAIEAGRTDIESDATSSLVDWRVPAEGTPPGSARPAATRAAQGRAAASTSVAATEACVSSASASAAPAARMRTASGRPPASAGNARGGSPAAPRVIRRPICASRASPAATRPALASSRALPFPPAAEERPLARGSFAGWDREGGDIFADGRAPVAT